jgi:DNA repair exonuclease SbcCD ATPase subunit
MKLLLGTLIALFLLTSCNLQKKLEKAKNLIENNGGYVLPDKTNLAKECNDQFPCITTEKETHDTSWIKKDSANKLVQKAIREATKDLRKDPIVITDSTSCIKAVEEYKRRISFAADKIDELADQIKETETIYTRRLEKQTIESTAKLKAVQSDLDKSLSRLADAQKTIAINNGEIEALNSKVKQFTNDETDIGYVLGLLWKIIMWPLIIAAVLFGLYKFRKLIPGLKLLPF